MSLFPALAKRAKVKAAMLSGGEQQMLAVARAVAGKPKVLLLDEMSTGLAPTIVASLLQLVRRLADDEGTAVILVEQHVRLALEVSDHAVVLVHGDTVLQGPAQALLDDQATLEDAYLGRRSA
jgi:branched-chain amino acid transport system ATP-binding protein